LGGQYGTKPATGPAGPLREAVGCFVYPFFFLHMGVFGLVGFLLSYSGVGVDVAVMQGIIAIPIYLLFYLLIFGRDEIEWMFINAGLGLFGIASQIDFILSFFGRSVADYPWTIHVIPFMYWIMYTFLIRHLVLDLFGARNDEAKRSKVQWGYVGGSEAFYALTHVLGF
jgi:hypothetical protein